MENRRPATTSAYLVPFVSVIGAGAIEIIIYSWLPPADPMGLSAGTAGNILHMLALALLAAGVWRMCRNSTARHPLVVMLLVVCISVCLLFLLAAVAWVVSLAGR